MAAIDNKKVAVKNEMQTAEALKYLINEWRDMSDSLFDIIEELCLEAGISCRGDLRHLDGDELDDVFLNACWQMLLIAPDALNRMVVGWAQDGRMDDLVYNIRYVKVDTIEAHPTYQAACVLHGYAKEHELNLAAGFLQMLLDRLNAIPLATVNMGYAIGEEYFRHLDPGKFGTTTNDCFTVGKLITPGDWCVTESYFGYSYVLHKDINCIGSPKVGMTAMFQPVEEEAAVRIDVKLYRSGFTSASGCCVGVVGYGDTVWTATVANDEGHGAVAEKIADVFNHLADVIDELAEKDPSLKKLLPYGETCRIPEIAEIPGI